MSTGRKRSASAKKAAKAQEEAQESQTQASEAQDDAAQALAEEQETKESQEEPREDSGLQTPQPDQPMPTEVERREGEPRKDDSDSEPRRQESETADDAPEQPRVDDGEQPDAQPAQPDPPEEFVKHVVHGGRSFRADVLVDDHYAVEERRQAELAEAREEHNRRMVEPELVKA